MPRGGESNLEPARVGKDVVKVADRIGSPKPDRRRGRGGLVSAPPLREN